MKLSVLPVALSVLAALVSVSIAAPFNATELVAGEGDDAPHWAIYWDEARLGLSFCLL